ncbi:MAG: nucleotidyltransferase family protein [Thermodesulfobacteriota bacterium]
MNRQAVIQTLSAHHDELRRWGVVSLALFGSTARDQAGQTSDVDLLAEFDRTLSLFEIFDLQYWLEDLLGGVKVDLVQKTAVHPAIKERILAEAIHVA